MRMIAQGFLLLTCLITSGCVTTDMWGIALDNSAMGAQIVGYLPADRSADRPAHHLIVSYTSAGSSFNLTPFTNGKRYYLAVPLKPDGSPRTEFVLAGGAETLSAVLKHIPEERLAVIANQRSSPDFALGQRLFMSPGFLSIDDPRCPIGTPPGSLGSRGAAILAYWPRVSQQRRVEGFDVRLPPGTQVILLPSIVDRPFADRLSNFRLAVLFTPVSLVEDVILPPVLLVAWSTGNLFVIAPPPQETSGGAVVSRSAPSP